jgi:hypothetical protein
VLRKAEPGAMPKKISQLVRGKLAKIGERLNVIHKPTISIRNKNAKSTACFRVSSMVTSQF